VNPDDNAARDRGLQRLNLLQVGETVVFFINSSLIYRTAFDAWNQQPRRLNGDGNPDPNGPIHLTSFSVSFESPNRVVTRIGGFDERPWPDVDFTVAITDTLALSAGGVRCDSVTTLDADTSWLNFLTGLFLIVFPPLGAVFLVERIIVGAADAPELGAGPGCSAAAMIFGEIMIPRGLKVVLSYRRLNVGTGGIFAGGSFAIVPRTPEVFLNGPTQISVPEGTSSVVRTYGVRTEDPRVTAHRLERRRRCFAPGRADDRHPLQLGEHLARASGDPARRRPRDGCRRIGRRGSSDRFRPRRAAGRRRFSAGLQTQAMAAAMSGADGALARRPCPAS
jgi:hypothetical protein